MMCTDKTIGYLLLAASISLLISYTILTIVFEYPDVLRQDTAVVLTKFHAGGSSLICIWFAFAITGIPLIPAYILLGQKLERTATWIRVATNIGLVGLIVQMIGLLRWTFVVPILADTFVHAADNATQASAVMSFKIMHQFAGVLLGEHMGQLFTIAWTVLISAAFYKMQQFPKWIPISGCLSAGIYLLAQAELFATVISGFPVWEMAGFIGSTLWLIWLLIVGIFFIQRNKIQ